MKATVMAKSFGAALFACMVIHGAATAQSGRFDELANAPLSGESSQTLKDELLFQRATQSYLWSMPAIMTLSMQAGSEKAFGGGYNVLPIWKQLTDASSRIITPNTVTMYAVNYLDLGRDGPLVMDMPPRLQGFLSDYWGVPIPVDGGKFAGDVGLPGPDHGKGGKYLLLPPGYSGDIPDGYYVFRSATNSVLTTFRAFAADREELPKAAALLETLKFYPLEGGEAKAAAMVYPDVSGRAIDMLPIVGDRAFDQLKLLVDREGDDFASPDMLGMLASIGIVKGKPFEPDPHTRTILDQAAKTAFNMARTISFEKAINGISQVMWPGRHWVNPFAEGTKEKPSGPFDFAFLSIEGRYRELDLRASFFSYGWGISPGMVTYTPGQGGVYAVAAADSKGAPLSGASNYRLHLPANVPAKLFWSVTLYDYYTASLYDNGQPFPAISSYEHLAQSADGSTDLTFGPTEPQENVKNWTKTTPGKPYFVILRFYGPTEAAIDRSWKPGDFEKVN